MYAVVTSGGKQTKVDVGDVFRVEKIEAHVGEIVELNEVHLLVKDDGIVADPGALSGAKVVCQIVGQGRARKIRVFKRKRKNNYSRTYGHRQQYTDLRVDEIVG
jgi:large subunit ribosomal protein L21